MSSGRTSASTITIAESSKSSPRTESRETPREDTMGISITARRLAIAGLLIAGTALATVAQAQSGKTITGGFDVGPGGLPKNFNPLVSTAGFTWLNTYFEPL